jgi:hypothetical protein
MAGHGHFAIDIFAIFIFVQLSRHAFIIFSRHAAVIAAIRDI